MNDFKIDTILYNLLNGVDDNQNKTAKLVYQYDKNDKLLNTYLSFSEASRVIDKGDSGTAHISECARGLRKSAYGYKWVLE